MPTSRRRVVRALARRWRALCVLCVVLGWTTSAQAATVAILSAGSSPALSEVAFRLRGELAALRFEVLLLRRPAGTAEAGTWLERAAEERGLDAAVQVVGQPTAEAVDVWIFQRSPRRSQVVRVVVEPGTPDRAGALAIRAIEVLRSYDLEAELSETARAHSGEPSTPSAAPTTTPKVDTSQSAGTETRPARDGRLGVELGAGVMTGLDGVGLALLPVLRIDWRVNAPWVLQVTASGLGTRATVRAPAGTVRVSQSYAALGVCFCPWTTRAPVPYFALAAGVTRATVEGTAVAPARGHTASHTSLLVDAGAGVRFALPAGYYATLSGHAQLAQPRVTIHAVNEPLGSIGRPNLLANLMVGTWL